MIQGSVIGRFIAAMILAVLVRGVWITSAGGAAEPPVTLRASEFAYAPNDVTTRAGDVTFIVKNEGAIEHNFVVQDAAKKKVAEIAIIEPGTAVEVRAVITSGTYMILCTLPGHREAGMVATLRVSP